MSSNHAHPKWWQLYLIFPLLIGLLAVDTRLNLPTLEHQAVQIGSVLIIFGLIHLWLKANARALSAMDRAQLTGKVRVIKIQPYQLSTMDNDYRTRPMFNLPASEIKGTLSDTFEIETIDAEYILSIDELHKN
jgi:hypothetical protein